jgi:hypothetical protein
VEVCNDGIDNNCDSDAGACVWDAEVDLTDFGILSGVMEGEYFGSEFASLDTDGDGTPEILVAGLFGASVTDPGMAAGVVEMYRALPARGASRSAAAWSLWGDADRDGAFLASRMDDLNDDGVDDVVIGSPGDDQLAFGGGALRVLFGPISSGGNFADSADWTVLGDEAYWTFGFVSAVLPDLSGDDAMDLVVASPGANVSTTFDGIVYLIEGVSSGEDRIDDIASSTLHGTALSGEFGTDFDAVDVDADGQHDLIVGMPYAYSGGAAFVFLGPIRGIFTEEDADHHLSNEAASAFLGQAVANAGDQDGDGLEDLLLTDSQNSSGGNQGAAYVLYAAADFASRSVSDADVKIRGDTRLDIGNSGDNIGDLNQDGFTDLAIGSFAGDTAAGYLFFGPLDSTGLRYVSSADVVLQGDTEDSRIHRIVNLGDMNGDGAPDLAVGSPYWDDDYLGRAFFLPGISW